MATAPRLPRPQVRLRWPPRHGRPGFAPAVRPPRRPVATNSDRACAVRAPHRARCLTERERERGAEITGEGEKRARVGERADSATGEIEASPACMGSVGLVGHVCLACAQGAKYPASNFCERLNRDRLEPERAGGRDPCTAQRLSRKFSYRKHEPAPRSLVSKPGFLGVLSTEGGVRVGDYDDCVGQGVC